MEVHATKWHQDYEKKAFMRVAIWVIFFSVLIYVYKDFQRASSFIIGFSIAWLSYFHASKRLISSNNAQLWFKSLIKVTVTRVVLAGVMMSILLSLKKQVPQLPIESVYVVIGFIFSVVIYKMRVVFGEVKNV